MTLSLAFQWWASIVTIAGVYFYTEKRVLLGSSCGILSQIGWWGFMFTDGAWGLIMINCVMLLLHGRAWLREMRWLST